MTDALKAKSAYNDADVTRVWRNIEDHVTADAAQQAVEAAAAEVRDRVANVNRAVYGWSGGKDSIALQVVMEAAGVKRAVLGIVGQLEFVDYLHWVRAHAPSGLNVFSNQDLTLDWLASEKAQRYLFPATSSDGYFWTMAGTRRAQRMYQDLHKPDVQIFGRRTQDGNVVGADGFYKGGGILSYSPIRDWTHEMVLAVCHYYDRPLPPTYDWPSGWTAGTGPWPGRRVGDEHESWRQTYAIEPAAVRAAAAAGVARARTWLEQNGHR